MTDWLSAALVPDWPAPTHVRAISTTRAGGVSEGDFAGFNLATHVGDAPDAVAANRAALATHTGAAAGWLDQVHGTRVAHLDTLDSHVVPDADASVATLPGRAAVVMTADCLPVLFCDEAGTVVAAAHAGWRGLCGGVLEATVAAMQATSPVMAWLGPAIGPDAFEVGGEVREAFMAHDLAAEAAFKPGTHEGKWLGDLYLLARQRLASVGVSAVYGGGYCTFSDERFFSYRRSRQTGRMASVVWIAQ
ncbi:peptidoglycan editing factor PgeF [Burkholderiaceae bacterium DAT-1]|nr:peptidoglycan editing factor PgeF [Burkholderiaceae bacterium DAT-1]